MRKIPVAVDIHFRCMILIMLCFTSFRVLATPTVTGVYSTSGIPTYVDSLPGGGCPIISPIMAANTSTLTLNILVQNGNSLEGGVSILSPSGASLNASVSGSVNNLGNLIVSGSSSNLNSVSIQGVFSNGVLTINTMNFDFAPAASNTCHANSSVLNLSRSTDTIDPERAAPTEAENNPNRVRTKTQKITKLTQKRTLGKHRQKQGGADITRLDMNGIDVELDSGMSAGDHRFDNLGVWLSYNFSSLENTFFRTDSDSDEHTVVGGVDLSPSDELIYGLALAYEFSDTDTNYNSGNLESDGFTIAPYVGVVLSDFLSVDASIGYTWVENDQSRLDPDTNTFVSSDPDGHRYFFNGNINTLNYIDNWIISGQLGFLWAKSATDAFVESDGTPVAQRDTKLGEVRFGGEVAYSYNEFEPFVSLLYEVDFNFDRVNLPAGAQPANDNNDILFSTGVRYFGNSGLTGYLEYSKRAFRGDIEEDSFSLTIRYDY